MSRKPTRIARGGGIPGIPMGTDPESVRQRIEAMEKLLEGLFVIPGINKRIGLDTLIGLVPVGGDVVTAVMGMWMVWEARNLGMTKGQMMRMLGRVGFDFLLGLIPGVGDVADFFYKSNARNLRSIRRHLDKNFPGSRVIDG